MNERKACDCSIWADDGEAPAVFREEERQARKAYKCCECRAPIKPGERYENATGLWDGAWATYRTCLTCARIRDDLCKGGYVYAGLREAIWECMGFDYVTGEEGDDLLTEEEEAEERAELIRKRLDESEPKLPIEGGW
jgi:hypothetical protein